MKTICLFLCFSLSAFASSVRIYNDSNYPLRGVIHAADGSKLGEVLVNPSQLMIWSDDNGLLGYHEPGKAETPFTVMWYCIDGTPYSVSPQVANAGMVTAQTSQGNRQCKTPPPPPPGSPNAPPPPTGPPGTQFYEQPTPLQPQAGYPPAPIPYQTQP